MIWLLDVKVLIGLLFAPHEHHQRVGAWLSGLPPEDAVATCAITELGYVRVLHQAPQYRVKVRDSLQTLIAFRNQPNRRVVFVPDDRGAMELPRWVQSGRQVTDGHLHDLAEAHGARLATLDKGIPGAFRIPTPP